MVEKASQVITLSELTVLTPAATDASKNLVRVLSGKTGGITEQRLREDRPSGHVSLFNLISKTEIDRAGVLSPACPRATARAIERVV